LRRSPNPARLGRPKQEATSVARGGNGAFSAAGTETNEKSVIGNDLNIIGQGLKIIGRASCRSTARSRAMCRRPR